MASQVGTKVLPEWTRGLSLRYDVEDGLGLAVVILFEEQGFALVLFGMVADVIVEPMLVLRRFLLGLTILGFPSLRGTRLACLLNLLEDAFHNVDASLDFYLVFSNVVPLFRAS